MMEESSCSSTMEENLINMLSALPGHACSIAECVPRSWQQPTFLPCWAGAVCLKITSQTPTAEVHSDSSLQFPFTTWKTISIHPIVVTRNASAKQVGREYVSLFTKSFWKTIIGFDDIWQFIKFTLMKLNLKMDCTFPALTCCRIGLKMSRLEAKATREVALV